MITSYADVRRIEADLIRWREEDAAPFECRAALIARVQRADNDTVRDSLLRLDNEFFDVIENDDPYISVAWRAR
jgi:hypothetical protein